MTEKVKLNPNNLNLRQGCFWFPCHANISDEEYDCRFCYCKFYKLCSENNNTKYGGYWLEYEDKVGNLQKVWACEKCNIVHTKDFVDTYVQLKEQNFDDEEIYRLLIKIY